MTGVQASVVNPLARLAFRLGIPDHGEVGAVTAANLACGVSDVSMTPSARRWGDRRIVIDTPDLAVLAQQYAPPERHRNPDVSPLYADLARIPPALLSCGTLDPLLDDTLFVATRWDAVGNASKVALQPGAPHEFLNLRDRISAEADARRAMADFVDRVLRG